jgi:phage I-like protein
VTTVAYYADLNDVKFLSGPNGEPQSWVHALPGGTYQHPVYGELKFDEPKIDRYVESVVKKYRTVDPDIDYDHKQDPAMGNRAAGWVKYAEARPGAEGNDLWLLVEWTPAGHKSVKDKEFRYFSSELADEWTDAKGTKYKDVVFGGGITNRPYMKNLVPLNLSELSFKEPTASTDNKGEQVDPKELRRKLGLSEAATDAEVDTRLAEVAKLGAPNADPQMDQLTKLAENNPVIKAFMDQMAKQNELLQAAEDRAKQAEADRRLSETQRKLGELTTKEAKVSFSASLLNDVMALMTGAPTQLSEKLFAVLKSISDGTGVTTLGELGELNEGPNHDGKTGLNAGSAEKKFNDAVEAEMTASKLSFADAVEKVARDKPQMYADYRKAVYIPADA